MNPLHLKIHLEIPRLEGWVSPERGCELADIILKLRPATCVELGVFGGRSLISQALALRENGFGKIYGVDPWKVEAALEGENAENQKWWSSVVDLETIHRGTMQALWRLGLDDIAIIIRAKSQHAASLFTGGIDMILIDGNHSEVASTRDVGIYLPLIRPGGIVYFDDTDWKSTQKAIAMLNEKCDLIRDAGTYRIYKKRA